MKHSRATKTYTKVDLQSTSPTDILDRLYQRLLRDIETARESIASDDLGGKAWALDHAHQIVAELDLALDFDVAPELCTQLRALYAYVADRLFLANQDRNEGHLRNAANVIVNLRDAYRIAAAQIHESAA